MFARGEPCPVVVCAENLLLIRREISPGVRNYPFKFAEFVRLECGTARRKMRNDARQVCGVCPSRVRNKSGTMPVKFADAVNDAHLDCCGGILGGHLYLRHEQLKAAVAGACFAADGKVAHVDANQDPVTTRLLRDSGDHQVGVRGGSYGGDILVTFAACTGTW